MSFPTIAPTSREVIAPKYPVKIFKSQSGSETRILYGSIPTDIQYNLSYTNIVDSIVEQFLDHYKEMRGEFSAFLIAPEEAERYKRIGPLKGWGGTNRTENSFEKLEPQYWDCEFRYAAPPQVIQVKPSISTVTIKLLGIHQRS